MDERDPSKGTLAYVVAYITPLQPKKQNVKAQQNRIQMCTTYQAKAAREGAWQTDGATA